MVLVTIISLSVRYLVCLNPTNDIVGYILNGWMKSIESVGFYKFYSIDADYSPLFLFIIAIFTCLPKGNEASINGYSQLTLGCANIWKFISVPNMDSKDNVLNKASTLIGLLFIGLFTGIIYIRRIKLTQENIVNIGTFLVGIVPFFLPHMHERYFYSLDVLILLYCMIKNKKYFYVILMQISSGIAYIHYLSGNYIINSWGEDSATIAAVINLFLLAAIFIDLLKLDHYTKEEYKDLIDKEKA